MRGYGSLAGVMGGPPHCMISEIWLEARIKKIKKSLEIRFRPCMRSKCFIQRCKTVIFYNGLAFKFPTQFLRRNSRGNLSLDLNYYISLCYSVRLANIIDFHIRWNHQINSSCMHAFLHFVVSLQSRFYTLALIFVFDVNIYSSSLRLFNSGWSCR